MQVQHFFDARKVEMSDGSDFWEVTSQDGERVASCTDETSATDLEIALNMALTDWVENGGSDRIANLA